MRTADRFCDLAGFDQEHDHAVYAHDGSQLTMIEVQGVRSIVSTEEFVLNVVERFAGGIAQILKRPGHQLSISYESSSNVDRILDPVVERQRRRAEQKGLAFDALIEEGRAVLDRRARTEKILLAAWTRPNAGRPEEVKRELKENGKAWRSLPPMKTAQNPYLRVAALGGPHGAFVRRILEALGEARLQGRVLGPDEYGRRRDLEEIRSGVLFHETPMGWSPYPAGALRYPGAKERFDDDVSEFFAPTVARQIMTSNATASANLRTVEIGGRRYAVAVMRMFPANIQPFNRLIESLLDASSTSAGMPFRVCLHLESLRDGDVGMKLRKVIAGLLAWASPGNKNLFRALQGLDDIRDRDGEAIVKARLMAATWTEPGEDPDLVERRRSLLSSRLMTWGEASISDAAHDPLRGLCETVSGLTLQARVAPGSIAPLGDLAAMMPFHRPAEVFEDGQTMLLTPEGKPMPLEAGSALQLYHLTVMAASPGSGKSMLFNRLNVEYVAFTPGPKLPFLGIIDLGISSSGAIELIQNALPPDRRHEACYIRPQNTAAYAVNFLDLGLFRRTPLERERVFIENFLTTLLNIDHGEIGQLITRLITRVYQSKSDLEHSSAPSIYQPDLDPEIDRLIRQHGIKAGEKMRWWRLVDEFALRGQFVAAERAQRYAAPVLEDFSRVLGEPIIAKDFSEELVRLTQRALESAIDKYPMFAYPTQLDLGPARVVSIDLQDVATDSKAPTAIQKNALMYMIARHIFLSKISGSADEISQMNIPSVQDLHDCCTRYWAQRYSEIAETPKRLGMDEYHLTGGLSSIRNQVIYDARTGRKYGLELVLVSHFISDFDMLKDIASTVFMLNSDSNEMREEARDTFGFTDAVKEALEKHVHGPQGRKGANFLARFKLREEERWIILNNSLGPRMLWALTTQPQDREVRNELYRRLTVTETLRVLSARFPDGTAIELWKRVAALSRAGDGHVAKTVADQIIGELIAGDTPKRNQFSRMQ